jgi:hypothetical protein
MRPLGTAILVVDRSLALFLGLAAGALITFSFFPGGGDPTGDAQSAPVVATAPAAAQAGPTAEAPPARLALAAAQRKPIQIGVFGDSFGDGVWAGLYHTLPRDEGFEVHKLSERSTGFTRYRSLNLLDDVRVKLGRQPVDIAILSFGANDTQGIYLDGRGHVFMSEGWQRIVTERVTAIVGLLRERGIMVYWIGLPTMRDPKFDADIARMNRFYATRMRALGVPYVGTAQATADADGHYVPYLHDPRSGKRFLARANDGVHMTIPGYVAVMRGLADRIRRSVVEARARAERDGPAQAAAGSGRVSGSPG